jgi:hypothetical protein
VEPLGRTGEHLRPRWLRETALLSGAATHVCCIAVVLITLGAGATLAGLVSAFPQLILRRERVSRLRVDCSLLPVARTQGARPTRAWRPMRVRAVDQLGALARAPVSLALGRPPSLSPCSVGRNGVLPRVPGQPHGPRTGSITYPSAQANTKKQRVWEFLPATFGSFSRT